jgi:hypothetical protein
MNRNVDIGKRDLITAAVATGIVATARPILPSLAAARSEDEKEKTEVTPVAEEFERKEHQLFGNDGFEMMTRRVADMERRIGINDLSQFTPQQ